MWEVGHTGVEITSPQAHSTAKGSKEFSVRVSVVQMRAFNYHFPVSQPRLRSSTHQLRLR